MHARNEHIFVVRSIPNDDHTLVRRHFVSAPKKIVIELHLCRCLESRQFKPGRVQAEAKSVERAVFFAGIHRLKKNQQTALLLGEQSIQTTRAARVRKRRANYFGQANFIALADDHDVLFHVIESTKGAPCCGTVEEFGYLTSTGMVLSLR